MVGSVTVFINQAGANLLEQTDHAGVTRAASHPQGQWVTGGIILAFKVPEE
jgi:hypothetical protein